MWGDDGVHAGSQIKYMYPLQQYIGHPFFVDKCIVFESILKQSATTLSCFTQHEPTQSTVKLY